MEQHLSLPWDVSQSTGVGEREFLGRETLAKEARSREFPR